MPDSMIPEDLRLSSYHFDLPEEQIAQHPSSQRGGSRLYVLRRGQSAAHIISPEAVFSAVSGLAEDSAPFVPSETSAFSDPAAADSISEFASLAEFLPARCLFVANNSRVIPARLHGRRPSGGKFELLLLTPLPLIEAAAESGTACRYESRATVLLRPAKKLKDGESYELGGENSGLRFTVLERGEFGQAEVLLQWNGELLDKVCACGSLPLPPYIRREASAEDLERYQTTFSDPAKAGSVAAPTAGLHFTPQMRQKLMEQGHEWAELTLFVGYGTFSPVRTEDIREHSMHPEYVEISAETIEKIRRAKADGRPVIAVGTTSTRVLEGLAEREAQTASAGEAAESSAAGGAELLKPYTGWLNCFIYPGKPIRVIDGLLTNFHLPESTLLMLVSTLCGRKRLLAAYNRAVREKFRFFSYGDAMLIL